MRLAKKITSFHVIFNRFWIAKMLNKIKKLGLDIIIPSHTNLLGDSGIRSARPFVYLSVHPSIWANMLCTV